MPLSHEQRQILININNRLAERLTQNPLPALCYALNPDIMPDEEYDRLKDADFAEIRDEVQIKYFEGIVLVFIRNFYENGCGNNYWQCTKSCNQIGSSGTHRFVDRLASSVFYNTFIPRTGQNVVDWVRSQCWILKVNDGDGRTSSMLRNNEAVYQILRQARPNVSWQNLLTDQNLFEDTELSPGYFRYKPVPEYVGYLFKHHRQIFAQSLYVIAAGEEKPLGLPGWLDCIWGLKRQVMQTVENQQVTINIRGCAIVLAYNNKYYLALKLHGWHCNNKRIVQGHRELPLKSDVLPFHMLEKNGFDLAAPLVLKDDEQAEALSLSDFLASDFHAFYSGERNIGSGIRVENRVPEENAKFSMRVKVLHKCRDIANLKYGDGVCKRLQEPVRLTDSDYYCSEFLLTPQSTDASIGSIGDEPLFEMRNPLGMELLLNNDVKASEHDGGNAYKVVIGDSVCVYSRVPIQPDRCEGLEYHEFTNGWEIRVEENSYYSPKEVVLRSVNQCRTYRLVFVPQSFFENLSNEWSLAEATHGYWTRIHGNLKYSCLIGRPVWSWDGDVYPREINEADTEGMSLCVYGPSWNMQLSVGNIHKMIDSVLLDGQTVASLLNYFKRDLIPGNEYTLKIDGVKAFTGAYRPCGACLFMRGAEIELYLPAGQISNLRITHELYYKNLLSLDVRQNWEKIVPLNQLIRNGDTYCLPRGLYQFNEAGRVIIRLEDNDAVYIETQTGVVNTDLAARWEDVALCPALVHFFNLKDTQLYEEMANAAHDSRPLTFDELHALFDDVLSQKIKSDYILTRSAEIRPLKCNALSCHWYDAWAGYCTKVLKKLPLADCAELVSIEYINGANNNNANIQKYVARILSVLDSWKVEVALRKNHKKELKQLWKNLKRDLNNGFISNFGDSALGLYDVMVFFCAAIILCNNAPIPGNAQFLLPYISQKPEILKKYILLVRFISFQR